MQTSLAVRYAAILLSLERIKLVIKSDEAYVFDIDTPEAADFLSYLQQQHIQLLGDSTSEDGTPKKFESTIVEAVLHCVCTNLFKRVNQISPSVTAALQHLQAESKGVGVLETQVRSEISAHFLL